MNYTPNIRKSSQTFVSVLQKAKDWFASLSKTEQQNLIDDLEHGAAHLTNARHTLAVFALNKGLSMSVVSRLLGHGSTGITEKVYAKLLPQTLTAEVEKLHYSFLPNELS